MTTKPCSKCGESYPLDKFLKHPQYRDGYGNVCRKCRNIVQNAHRAQDVERHREHKKRNIENRLERGRCKQCASERLPYSNAFCEHHYYGAVAQRVLGTSTNEAAHLLKAKMEAQNFTCPYTGDALVLGLNTHFDHILPASRYPELARDINNLQWVSTAVNQAKAAKTPEEFIAMCHLVVRHRKD